MSLLKDPSAGTLRIVSMLACFAKGRNAQSAVINDLPAGFEQASGSDGRNHIAFLPRGARRSEANRSAAALLPVLVLGDDWEWQAYGGDQPMANATAIACRLDAGRLEVLTAIPGLPPVYLTETEDCYVLASDLHLMRCVAGLGLRFDRESIIDLARVGRPVAHRTLFRGVRLMSGGSLVAVKGGDLTIEPGWKPPVASPSGDWDEYTALQADAFGRAAASLDYSDAVLSLTAGLDTRAILAGLVENDAKVPAITVTGETQCLDARTASRLCEFYGMSHRSIALDESFCRDLPDLADRASFLSGGIGSVGHAAQIYCYHQLGTHPPDKMLSGYLGNQIGRLGTEGLTPRAADTALLSDDLTNGLASLPPVERWYADAMRPDGHLEPRFLIQQESMFGNLASYSIGNSHSVQQSTYGSRELIENLWRMPPAAGDRGSARFHDLKHRFFGEPLAESFQRRYINRVGGPAAEYPVNWGWRSSGGVSLPGLLWGGLALVDAVVSTRFAGTPAMRLIRMTGIAGLHEYRPVHHWMHGYLKDFVYDTLLSRSSADAGLFDSALLARRLDEYYSGRSQRYGDLLLAVDLALAAKNFGATI